MQIIQRATVTTFCQKISRGGFEPVQVCKHATPAASLLTLPIRQPSRHDTMHRPVSTFVPAPAPVHIKLKVEGAPLRRHTGSIRAELVVQPCFHMALMACRRQNSMYLELAFTCTYAD